jgi:hypothetical protein
MAKITQGSKQKKNRQQVKYQILYLDHPSDDDPSKFYYLESLTVKGKYYRLVATAFGALSCSCTAQVKNPYMSCKHMKILDEIIDKSTYKIQSISKIPQLILNL